MDVVKHATPPHEGEGQGEALTWTKDQTEKGLMGVANETL